jgi:hypothetical protein
MPIAVCGSHDVPRAGAACLPVASIVVIDCGRGPLMMLFAPLPVALGAIFGKLDGKVE